MKTQRLLIDVINSFLKNTLLPDCQNWEALFSCAKKHSLGVIFYQAIKRNENVPEKVKQSAKAHAQAQISQQIQQEYFAEEIFRRLEEKSVKYMPMKGYILRTLYPSPELRSSCDVDIFYDKTRKQDVEAAMQGLGFSKEGNIEWGNGVVTVEMHDALIDENQADASYYQNAWERLQPQSGMRYDFSAEDFYVYFIRHAKTHFLGGGFGIRMLLDIYVYLTKQPSFDRQYVKAELEKLGLQKFADCLEQLAFIWFDGRESTQEMSALEKYIFQSGAYGIDSNKAAILGAKGETSAKGAQRRYVFKTVFPPFTAMKGKYPFLKKVPFLLPVMWVYKWFEVLFTRRKKFRSTVRNMKKLNEEKFQDVSKILEMTGL